MVKEKQRMYNKIYKEFSLCFHLPYISYTQEHVIYNKSFIFLLQHFFFNINKKKLILIIQYSI